MSWNKEWFVHDKRFKKDYWDNIANQAHFLNSLASEFHLNKVTDWYRITSSLIKKKGGTVQVHSFLTFKKIGVSKKVQKLFVECIEYLISSRKLGRKRLAE